jgi:hypothetical protein
MSSSIGEKAILVMLSDVLEALKVPAPTLDPEFVRSAVSGDHFWAFEWKLQFLGDGSPRPPELVEVLDILDAWRVLKLSFAEADTARFLAETRETEIPILEGFDANNEDRHLSIARFLVEQLDRFPELKDQVINSHAPNLAYYGRLVHAMKSMEPDPRSGLFSTDQLIEIFNEVAV